MQKIKLIKPIEKFIQKGHPWIFRDALEPFSAPIGSEITVLDTKGNFCCRGLVEDGPIAVRVFLLKDRNLDMDVLSNRFHKALQIREPLFTKDTNSFRLIHGEGDFLPGIILDKYDTFAVLYFDGQAILTYQDKIYSILSKALQKFEIKNLLFRFKKKHEKQVNAVYGNLPDEAIKIKENGMILWTDLINGQKTGMFLDHRDSRFVVRNLSKDKTVLNLYSYTGGFSISAGLGGAKLVTSVDIASEAIKLAEKSWNTNGLKSEKHKPVVQDVPEFMENFSGKPFDLIISDPPSFAPNHNSVPNALKAYKMLHASALDLLSSGGTYIAASCSSHIDRKMFEESIYKGAEISRKRISILEHWGPGIDHPTRKSFPEGEYLKVFHVKKI